MSDRINDPPPTGPLPAEPPPLPSSSLRPPPPAPTLRRAGRSPATIPFYAHAAQPEIVRANQKDLYYLRELSDRIEDVARSWLGPRWLQAWSSELAQGSKLAYFGLTTLLGTQTLGEEYVDIVQCSTRSRRRASPIRRATLLLLHILTPYLLSRLYSLLRRQLIARHADDLAAAAEAAQLDSLFASSPGPPPPPKPRSALERVKDWLAERAEAGPSFEQLTQDYLRSVHLAVFYLWGRYYHISKRITGIRFISTQPGRSAASPSAGQGPPGPSSYEVLGVLMAVQLAVRALLALRQHRQASQEKAAAAQAATQQTAKAEEKSESTEPENPKLKRAFAVDGVPLRLATFDPDDGDSGSAYPDEEGDDARERRCTLCLGPRRDQTATECGHLFCWECIVGWAREKAECPLCRQRIQLNRLLPVYNI